MDQELFLLCFWNIFLAHNTHDQTQQLVIDNHSRHICLAIIKLARASNVIILASYTDGFVHFPLATSIVAAGVISAETARMFRLPSITQRRLPTAALSAQIQYCANCESICDTICEECEVSIHNECSLAADAGSVHYQQMLTDLAALTVAALNHKSKLSWYCLSTYSYFVLHRVQYLFEIFTADTVNKFTCVPHPALIVRAPLMEKNAFNLLRKVHARNQRQT